MQGQFVRLGEAAERLGVSGPALRRRIAGGELATYADPRDKRSKLIRIVDLETYATPRPITPRSGDDDDGGEGRAA